MSVILRGMRVIYSTPRLENAERVAQLLGDAGVPVRVLFGPKHRRPSWKGANYRQAQDPGNWPRVMVLNNGDLPKARTTLRALGLLEPAGFERAASPDDGALRFRQESTPASAPARGIRPLRVMLIVVALLVAGIQLARQLF